MSAKLTVSMSGDTMQERVTLSLNSAQGLEGAKVEDDNEMEWVSVYSERSKTGTLCS